MSVLQSMPIFLRSAVLCCAIAAPLFAQGHEANLAAEARECFELASRLAKSDGGALWGVSFEGPLLIVEAATRRVTANQADAQGLLALRDGVWVGDWPQDRPIANTSVEWGGKRWAMMQLESIPASPLERGRLLMHETFHRLQPTLGLAAQSPVNAHLDSQDGRTWMRLEMNALAAAVSADGVPRRTAAIDALLFRAMRRQLVGDAAAEEELALEANEGLSEYAGVMLSGMNQDEVRAAVTKALRTSERAQQLSRSFAYATGPAYGTLLDAYQPGWRKSVATNPNLAARLGAALNRKVAGSSLQAAAAQRSAAYNGPTIIAEETDRAAKHARRVADLKAKFVDGRVLRIVAGKSFNFSFDPNRAEPLDSTRVVHPTVHITDDWGTLDTTEGALIDFSPPMSVTVPVPAGATPERVPWKLTLNEPYTLEAPADGLWRVVEKK